MKRFAELYGRLETTTSTAKKIARLQEYLAAAPPADAAWAVYFLSRTRFKRVVGPRTLGTWAAEEAALPPWLMDECYETTGDLAEALTLLIDSDEDPRGEALSLAAIASSLEALRAADEDEKRETVLSYWKRLPESERFVFNKMLTGAMRVGVSRLLVVRALAAHSGQERDLIEHRMTGDYVPTVAAFAALMAPDDGSFDVSKPYPFFLASPLAGDPEELGALEDFVAEWKWDGIRAQLIVREGELAVWSRGEERVEDRFPELDVAKALPSGTVLDGELLIWDHDAERPADFAVLQTRINRKKPSAKRLRDQPARFIAYDLLEWNGVDLREEPLRVRRGRLEAVLAKLPPKTFAVSEAIEAGSWKDLHKEREGARERGVEGLMLKRLDSPYRTGRRRGDWWKWKLEPMTLDCVLTMAQSGSGQRAGLFTDYTFGIWADAEDADDESGGERRLVSIAKAYTGLSREEIAELDKWIRRHTLERYGPVRAVEAVHVFEIAFEGLRASKRHKSGLAVRFPRIKRWRRDKSPADANSVDDARALLEEFT